MPTRQLVAELLGTALLLSIVVGSGLMAERLADGNETVALLANTFATGAGLIVLIQVFGPLSGAHFNPVVTLVMLLGGETRPRMAALFTLMQVTGAVLGVWVAHAMFSEPLLQVSSKARDGGGQLLSELVATFGLIATILATQRSRPQMTPVAVGLYIGAAYWFTASTSFANPAVTLARTLTDSFAGIAPHSAPAFILGQTAGALAGALIFNWMYQEAQPS